MNEFRLKIRQLYTLAADLGQMFPGRKFTPDGHLVGSIGEAIAKIEYGIELHPHSHPGTDGVINGRDVQIKATQGKSVALKQPAKRDLLVVIKINLDGSWQRIYDGDALRVWNDLKKQKTTYLREKTISLKRLQALQANVDKGDRLINRTSSSGPG